jgi:hypothetical protein
MAGTKTLRSSTKATATRSAAPSKSTKPSTETTSKKRSREVESDSEDTSELSEPPELEDFDDESTSSECQSQSLARKRHKRSGSYRHFILFTSLICFYFVLKIIARHPRSLLGINSNTWNPLLKIRE